MTKAGVASIQRGHTLVELLTVMALTTALAAAGLPLFARIVRDQQFKGFAAELAGHLSLARRVAQRAETSARFDFEADADYRYRGFVEENGALRPLAHSAWGRGYRRRIRCRLPESGATHPTSGRALTAPVSGLHAPSLIFGPRGSGGGTLVFSDGEGRALCAVVSPQSGEARLFLKIGKSEPWRVFP